MKFPHRHKLTIFLLSRLRKTYTQRVIESFRVSSTPLIIIAILGFSFLVISLQQTVLYLLQTRFNLFVPFLASSYSIQYNSLNLLKFYLRYISKYPIFIQILSKFHPKFIFNLSKYYPKM